MRTRVALVVALAEAAFLLVGCAPLDATGSSTSSPDGGGTGPYASERQRCIDETNRYRATIDRAPLARSAALEDFAFRAAYSDAQSNTPHGYFSRTNGGGVAFAENAVPGWPLAQFGSAMKVVDVGLEAMWGEGPGGGHYENMAASKFKEVGCGFAQTVDGKLWVVQNFR